MNKFGARLRSLERLFLHSRRMGHTQSGQSIEEIGYPENKFPLEIPVLYMGCPYVYVFAINYCTLHIPHTCPI